MAKLDFTQQVVNWTRSQIKVLDLWTGSTNNAAPANWYTTGFSDSGWATPVAPTFVFGQAFPDPTKYSGAGAYGPYVQPTPFAPWASTPSFWANWLWRMHFTVTDATWAWFLSTILVNALSGSGGVMYLNGTQVSNWYSIGDTNLLQVGDNLLAGGSYGIPSGGTFGSGEVGTTLSNYGGGGNATGTPSSWWANRLILYQPGSITASRAYAWGTPKLGVSDKGVLGVADTSTHLTPTVVDNSNFTAPIAKIASNGKTTLFLDSEGTLYGSGDNSQGMALANGSTDTSVHSTPVSLPSTVGGPLSGPGPKFRVVDVSIGDDCAAVLTRYGEVVIWGPNAHGSIGRGDTTAQLSPLTIVSAPTQRQGNDALASAIGCGKDFFVYASLQSSFTSSGGNTYGQLGHGTSGSDVLTRAVVDLSSVYLSPARFVSDLAAGDGQLVIIGVDTSAFTGMLHGCGRADFGSLSNNLFSIGTGPNKIVTAPHAMRTPTSNMPMTTVQAGPLTFIQADGGGIGGVPGPWFVHGYGDGTPYGGAGDADGSIVYGTGSTNPEFVVVPLSLADTDFPVVTIADMSGGSQNPSTAGNSKAVFAAVYVDTTVTPNVQKLATWGWGGAGQMGSGSDATTNVRPVNQNGLLNVIGATVAEGIIFAISDFSAGLRFPRFHAYIIG